MLSFKTIGLAIQQAITK